MTVKSKVLQKLMNKGRKGNPLDRLAELEQKSMGAFLREPAAIKLSDITSDLGTIVNGAFIAPASISASAEPTSTDFTGAFMSGDGYTYPAGTFNLGGVADGAIQVGIGTTDGKLYAGAGNVTIDANGVAIVEGTAGGLPGVYTENGITFLNSGGNAVGQVLEYLVGGTGYRWIISDVVVPSDVTHKAINRLSVLDSAGNQLSYLYVTGDGTIEAGTESAGTTITLNTGTGTVTSKGATINGFLNLGTPTELTISGGVVTATQTYHTIDTQADAATDDLDTINGGTSGDILVLRSADSGRDTTIKDNTGNIQLEGDFTLSNVQDTIMLLKVGTSWYEMSRSNNL